MISTEPYLDWTSQVQRNGRNNRRGGLSDLRYARWMCYQYSMALKWPSEEILTRILGGISNVKNELELPTLTSLGIEELGKVEGYTKASKAVFARYTSAVITSILRDPIIDLRPNEKVIDWNTLLEPYQIARVRAIKHPATEVLNLIGGTAVTSAAFDLPFINPVPLDEDPAAKVTLFGKTQVPAHIQTKYTLALYSLKQYVEGRTEHDPNIDHIIRDNYQFKTEKDRVEFATIVRNASGKLFAFYSNVYIFLDPAYFEVEDSRELLLRLVQLKLATWFTKVPMAPTRESKKRPAPLQHCLTNINFLEHRLQPTYEPQETTRNYVNQFFTYFEGDREQKSIEIALFPGAVNNARVMSKWNNAVTPVMEANDAFSILKTKLDPSKRQLNLEWQREIQHAVSVMQYYGLLNWNMGVVLLAGVATSLPKIKKNDLIYCALYAAHCYRAGLVSVAPFNREWDVNFAEMTLEECTNFLALAASWTMGATTPMLSTRYIELLSVADEPLWKIFSELYYNFSFSIKENLALFSRIVDEMGSTLRTTTLVDKMLATKQAKKVRAGYNVSLVTSALLTIRKPENSEIPYNQVIVSAMPANSRNLKVATFLGVDLELYARDLLSDDPLDSYVSRFWPAVEARTDEDAVYVRANYTKEALLEYIEQKIAKGAGKLPSSFEYLRSRVKIKAGGNYLPFRDVNQLAKKQVKSTLVLFSLTDPTNLESEVVSKVGDNAPVQTGRTLLELLKDDKIVYYRDINPEWNFGPLTGPLLDLIAGDGSLNADAIEPSLKDLMNKKKITAVISQFDLLFRKSGFLELNNPFPVALLDRFPQWESVSVYQKEVLPLYAALTIEQVQNFQALVAQVMPRANFYWELFRLSENGAPAPKLILNDNFKLKYLTELASREVQPLEINIGDVEQFSTKLRQVQLIDSSIDDVLTAMAKVKFGVPGVSLFVGAGRALLLKAEKKLYEMEGVTKQKKASKPKGAKSAKAEDSEEEEEAVAQSPKRTKTDEEEDAGGMITTWGDLDVDDDLYQSYAMGTKLCSLCFLDISNPECKCN